MFWTLMRGSKASQSLCANLALPTKLPETVRSMTYDCLQCGMLHLHYTKMKMCHIMLIQMLAVMRTISCSTDKCFL